MPFLDVEETPGYSPVALPGRYTAPPKMPGQAPTWGEGWDAAVNLENDIANTLAWAERENYGDLDRDHNPADFVRGTDLEPHLDAFVGSRNERETKAIAERVRQELKWRKTLEQSGTWGFVSPILSSILSPTTFIPGGQVLRAARGGAAVRSAMRSAASVGGLNVGAAAIQEAVLQNNQYTRTMLESALNIAGAGVLGGALGGVMSGASSAALSRTVSSLNDMGYTGALRREIDERLAELGGVAPGSAGAASTALPKLELESTGGLAGLLARAGPLAGPDLKMMNSPLQSARELYAMIGDSILYTTRNADGIPTGPRGGTIEARLKTQGVAREAKAVSAVRSLWMEHYFGGKVGLTKRLGAGAAAARGKTPAGKLSEKEFKVEVGKALARQDKHEIPEVAKAAKAVRDELIDPLADRAVTFGLLESEIVHRMRPGGAKAAVGNKPRRARAPDVEDTLRRQFLKDLVDGLQATTGRKFDEEQLNRVINELAADEDLLRSLQDALGGGPSGFAISPETGRLVRGDGQVIGKSWTEIADELEEGRPVEIQSQVLNRLEDDIVELNESLPPSLRDVRKYVVTHATPLGDGRNVRVVFRDAWSDDIFDEVMVIDDFRLMRAGHIRGRMVFRASAIGDVPGGIGSRMLLNGQVWHEGVHALFSGLRKGSTEFDVTKLGAVGRVARHAENLRILEKQLGTYLREIDDPSWRFADDTTLRAEYERIYGSRADKDNMITEEAVAHMMELRVHGALSDADLAPIADDLLELFGDMPVSRGADDDMAFAIGGDGKSPPSLPAGAIGRSDDLGFYSKAVKAARSWKQAKGTPEQVVRHLEKAGVKPAEIEATSLEEFLDGQKSVTRDGIVAYLELQRTPVMEARYEPLTLGAMNRNSSYATDDVVRAVERADDVDDVELILMNDGDAYRSLQQSHPDLMENEEWAEIVTNDLFPAGVRRDSTTKYSGYSIDPSNPTYRETVLHLPEAEIDGRTYRTIDDEISKLYNERAEVHGRIGDDVSEASQTDLDRFDALGDEILRLEKLRRNIDDATFSQSHFSDVPNAISHLRTSIQPDAEGRSNFVINELQSDWGQKIRDSGGVRDEAKIAELKKQQEQVVVLLEQARAMLRESEKSGGVDQALRDEISRLDSQEMRINAEAATADSAAPGHPLVNTTDQWVNTSLRRALRQAVEENADYIAIASGETVDSFGMGAPVDGLKYAYNEMYPKKLRDIIKKIDKDAAKIERVENLYRKQDAENYPVDMLERAVPGIGDGFTRFPITDKLRKAVMGEGQPLFAIGGAFRAEPNPAMGPEMPPPRPQARIRDNYTRGIEARERITKAHASEKNARKEASRDLAAGFPVAVSSDAIGKIRNLLDDIGSVQGLRLGAVASVRPIDTNMVEIGIIGNVRSGETVTETIPIDKAVLFNSQAILSRDGRRAFVFHLAGGEIGDDTLRGQVAKVVAESAFLRGKVSGRVRDRLLGHVETYNPLGITLSRYARERGDVMEPRFGDMTLRDYYTTRFGDDPEFSKIIEAKSIGHLVEMFTTGRNHDAGVLSDIVNATNVPSGNMDFAISALAERNGAVPLDDIPAQMTARHPDKPILAFHGTAADEDFRTFDVSKSDDIGVHVGTVDQANDRVSIKSEDDPTRVKPVLIDVKNPMTSNDLGNWAPDALYKTAIRQGIEFPLEAEALFYKIRQGDNVLPEDWKKANQMVRDALEGAGYDGIRYLNQHEGHWADMDDNGIMTNPKWSYIVWNKGSIRSATDGDMMLAIGGKNDLLSKIRSLGGISDETGDLANMEAPKSIINPHGMHPDKMREALMQEGYLDDADMYRGGEAQSDVDDLYDAIRDAIMERGAKSASREAEADAIRKQAASDYEEYFGEYDITDAEMDRIVHLVQRRGMSIDDALENFRMGNKLEDKPKPEKLSGYQEVEFNKILRKLDEALSDSSGGDGFDPEIAQKVWDDNIGSYAPRIYRQDLIIAKRGQFKSIISEYFEQAQTRAGYVLKELERTLDPAKAKADDVKNIEDLRQFTGLQKQELDSLADKVIDTILGHNPSHMLLDLPPGLRGPLKSRTLRIPDTFVGKAGAFEDFLDRDIGTIARHYNRTMTPQIELVRMFGKLDMEEQIAMINDEANSLMERSAKIFDEKIAAAPDDATRARLIKEKEAQYKFLDSAKKDALKNFQAVIEKAQGLYGVPNDSSAIAPRAVQVAKAVNFMTKLGGMTVSAFTDVARPIMTQGLEATYSGGLAPMLRGFKGMRAMKLASEEITEAGTALEMIMPRGQAIADVLDDYGRYSAGERGIGWAADRFGYLALMNQWNGKLKKFTGVVAQTRMLKTMRRVAEGTASKDDIRRLAKSNISDLDAKIIADQFGKHGIIDEGVYIPNTKAWDKSDPNVAMALDTYRAALVTEIDTAIVTPGFEKPLWLSTWQGSLVGQFKSFAFASVTRTLLLGLQQRDAGTLFGAMMMVGLGMQVEFIKAYQNNKPLPETVPQWLLAGFDRSGLHGWLMEANHLMERSTGGTIGLSAMTGKQMSRYASRNIMDAFLGPTAGTIGDLVWATSGISRAIAGKSELRESDLAALRRSIPLQNLFYLAYLFQQAERGAANALGVQQTNKRRSFDLDQLKDSMRIVSPNKSNLGAQDIAAAQPDDISDAEAMQQFKGSVTTEGERLGDAPAQQAKPKRKRKRNRGGLNRIPTVA